MLLQGLPDREAVVSKNIPAEGAAPQAPCDGKKEEVLPCFASAASMMTSFR
jgi:hypothetical protein